MRRIVGSLLLLAMTLCIGCSSSDDVATVSGGEASTVQPRSVPEIWADMLGKRDRLQAAISKGTEMWHEDCAEVASAAAALDTLTIELNRRIAEEPGLQAQRKSIQQLVGYFLTTVMAVRTEAIDEAVGALPRLMISVDSLLQTLEARIPRELLGSESVATRPGFNPFAPPPPPSPV